MEPQEYRYVPEERRNHIAKTRAKLSNEGTGLHSNPIETNSVLVLFTTQTAEPFKAYGLRYAPTV